MPTLPLPLLLACAPAGWEHDYQQVPTNGPDQPCSDDGQEIRCVHHESRYSDRSLDRVVLWQLPAGAPPASGWPAALVFQGTGQSAGCSWQAGRDDAWGGWWQAQLSKAMLEAGFAVVTPGTRLDGTWWDTNVLPWSQLWESSRDHKLMQGLLAGMEDGELGPLDPDALYATGISSGGYMTSRMAVSYEGSFRALAIQSGSYATCSGALCSLPDLPADHPPTLFLHGEQDWVVPLSTMQDYCQALQDAGLTCEALVDPQAGHEWLPEAPTEIAAWFGEH